jgi:hypothetical protein
VGRAGGVNERQLGERYIEWGKDGSSHDPSTARPDAPNGGAEEKSGRFGRDDRESSGE